MLILYAMLAGFMLDLIFGDPAWLPHPVEHEACEHRIQDQHGPVPSAKQTS